MNKVKWIFFDIGSTLVDESVAYKNRIKKTIVAGLFTYIGSSFLGLVVFYNTQSEQRQKEIEDQIVVQIEYQKLRRLIKDKAIRKNTEKMLLNLDLSEKYRFQLPISTRKNDALLMLYSTETLDLLPPDAQIDAHLKHQKGIFRPRAVKKSQKQNSRKWLV